MLAVSPFPLPFPPFLVVHQQSQENSPTRTAKLELDWVKGQELEYTCIRLGMRCVSACLEFGCNWSLQSVTNTNWDLPGLLTCRTMKNTFNGEVHRIRLCLCNPTHRIQQKPFCRGPFLSFLMLTCFCSIACYMAPPRCLLRGSLQVHWQILKASAEKTKDREGRIKRKETQLNVFDFHWRCWTYQRFTPPYFWAAFHGVDVLQAVAPFISQRTPGLFPVLGSYK